MTNEKFIPEKGKEWPERSTVDIVRDYYTYLTELGFSERNLRDKLILDLGSGPRESIANSKRLKGLGAHVVSLNPDYNKREYRDAVRSMKAWKKMSVAGIGQELPFKDDTFDYIWAQTSITLHADPIDYPDAEKYWGPEVCRVLKPGGEARLAPVIIWDFESKEKYEKLRQSLKQLGMKVKIEKIPNKDLPREVHDPDRIFRMIIKKPNLHE